MRLPFVSRARFERLMAACDRTLDQADIMVETLEGAVKKLRTMNESYYQLQVEFTRKSQELATLKRNVKEMRK